MTPLSMRTVDMSASLLMNALGKAVAGLNAKGVIMTYLGASETKMVKLHLLRVKAS